MDGRRRIFTTTTLSRQIFSLSRTPKPLPHLFIDPKTNIDDYDFDDFKLLGYNPSPAIKAQSWFDLSQFRRYPKIPHFDMDFEMPEANCNDHWVVYGGEKLDGGKRRNHIPREGEISCFLSGMV